MQTKKYSILGFSLITAIIVDTAMASSQFIYFGGEPVYSSTYFNWKNTDNYIYDQDIINKANTLQAELFLGYGILLDQIYLGFEGAAQLGSRRVSKEQTCWIQAYNAQINYNNSASMNNIYIIDFRPGYVWLDKNSMLYGILGINSANFSLHQTNKTYNSLVDSNASRRTGIRIGLGYNLGLTSFLLARVEYAYTKFSSFNATDNNGNQISGWQLNPSSNEISLGFAFIIKI